MAKKRALLPIFLILFNIGIYSVVWTQEDNQTAFSAAQAKRDKAVQLARDGNASEALPFMEEALRLSEDAPEFRYDYIVILSWAERHAEAIKNFEDLQKDLAIPDYVFPEVAASYRRLGEYDKAIQQYEKYLSLHPADPTTIRAIVYCYLDVDKTEEANAFINAQKEKHPQELTLLNSLSAHVLLQKGDIDQALQLYTETLKDNPDDVHAQIGLVRASLAKGKDIDARERIDTILEKDPSNYEALICKGEILETEKKYWQAYQHYEGILILYPKSRVIRELRYRALMELGCTSLVKELLQAESEQIDPAIKVAISGDEAMARLRWDEPREGLNIIKRNRLEIKKMKGKYPAPVYLRTALLRNYYDRLESLRMQEEMLGVVRQYELMKEAGISIPAWTQVHTADAYLYLQNAEKALELYLKALEDGWDPEGSTRMSIYDTYIELGKFKEAQSLLDTLDSDTPNQINLRGVSRDNWEKENIVINRGWCLMYQDRLSEAQEYLQDYLSRAPANTHIRSTLAHNYLWRGWPRLALEEFRISRAIDDQSLANDIGTAYAMNENGLGLEARQKAKELFTRYPRDKHVRELNRYFAVQDMGTLTIQGEYAVEHPGAHGLTWLTRIEQPILPWRSFFAEYIWRKNQEANDKSLIRRVRLGTDWRMNRDWWFNGGVSFDQDGRDTGHFETLTLTPNDYWLFSTGYDSYIVDLPVQEAANDISADEYSLSAQYRASESFSVEALATYNNFNDDNERFTHRLIVDTALTTAAYWKTRLALEASAETNSRTSLNYFSPDRLYTFYLIPMVEHTWFKRYQRELTERFYLGLGGLWQKYYGSNEIWYVRYELEHRMSDLWNALLGTTYAQENYDGEDIDVWTIYLRFQRHF